MIIKTITLKHTNSPNTTAVVMGRDEKEIMAEITALLTQTGAYGFGTQSRTVC